MAKLTIKQQRFADEYIISGNATQSAISAGYAEKSARFMGAENLTKPHIFQYINEKIEIIANESIAKQEEILKYLTSLLRGEQKEQILRSVGNYEQVIEEIEVSAKDRIKAAELLGKRYGMWTDKFDLSGGISVVIVDDID